MHFRQNIAAIISLVALLCITIFMPSFGEPPYATYTNILVTVFSLLIALIILIMAKLVSNKKKMLYAESRKNSQDLSGHVETRYRESLDRQKSQQSLFRQASASSSSSSNSVSLSSATDGDSNARESKELVRNQSQSGDRRHRSSSLDLHSIQLSYEQNGDQDPLTLTTGAGMESPRSGRKWTVDLSTSSISLGSRSSSSGLLVDNTARNEIEEQNENEESENS